jgi:hypothetical protein
VGLGLDHNVVEKLLVSESHPGGELPQEVVVVGEDLVARAFGRITFNKALDGEELGRCDAEQYGK